MNLTKTLILLICGYLILILKSALSPVLLSQSTVESANYKIQMPNLNSGAGIPSSSSYKVDTTIGQTAAGLYSSTGFRVRSGFQYIHSIIPFSFEVSDISIDFGTLTIGVGATQSTTLTVKAGGAGGYNVYAAENHPLQNDAETATIPDTTCDTALCSQTNADPWILSSTYGFGFNMSGDDIPADFVDTTYFRHFADSSVPENSTVIMGKSEVTWDYPNNTWPWESIATLTFKINIGSGQTSGTFRNLILLTAVPTF